MNKNAKNETFKYFPVYNNNMRKNILYGTLFLFAIILSLSLVSAGTWNNPTTGSTVKGSQNFNFSITTLNATKQCNMSTTDMGIFVVLNNDSASDFNFNSTNNTALFTESASTVLNATCGNGTSYESSIITIGIDNTSPVCAFTVDSESTKYLSPIGIATTDTSTDLTTLSYNITLFDGSNSVKSSKSTSTATFSSTDLDSLGTYSIAQIVTDLALTATACTNKSIFVYGNDGDIPTVITAQQVEKTTTSTTLFIIVGVAVVFLILVAIFIFWGISKVKGR